MVCLEFASFETAPGFPGQREVAGGQLTAAEAGGGIVGVVGLLDPPSVL